MRARAEKRAPVRNSSRAADWPIFASTNGEMTAGRMPSFTSVNPNMRVLLGDDDVADGGEAGAAAERRAVDAADERHRQVVERGEHARASPSRRAGSPPRCSRTVFDIHVEVGARAERLAGAGEDDGAHVSVPRARSRAAQAVSSAITSSLNALRTSGRFRVRCSTVSVASSGIVVMPSRQTRSTKTGASCTCLRRRGLTSGRRRTSRPESAR